MNKIFFLISKKKRSIKALIRKLEKKWKINCDQANIYDEIKTLFEKSLKVNHLQVFLTFRTL